MFNQFDLNSKKWKPLSKHWHFSNLLTVLIISRLFECLWSFGNSVRAITWNLRLFWNSKPVEIMVLAIDWGELWSMLLVPQRMKIYFKCKLEEKWKLFTLHKTFSALSPAIPKPKAPWLLKYFLHILGKRGKFETNESPAIKILDLLFFKRRF